MFIQLLELFKTNYIRIIKFLNKLYPLFVMEVKISFDTEKESVDDIKRLIGALQDLVSKREKGNTLGNPLTTVVVTKPSQINVQQSTQPVRPGNQTSGGGRVVPYTDMSDILSKLASGGGR